MKGGEESWRGCRRFEGCFLWICVYEIKLRILIREIESEFSVLVAFFLLFLFVDVQCYCFFGRQKKYSTIRNLHFVVVNS